MDSLRLARENYGDRLFIHPPFFVYSSALLRRLFKLPLPGYALLCQLLTLCLLPVLVYSVSGQMATDKPLSRFQQMTSGTALWAIAAFSCCPIAAFCSQKIWIDNALMFTVTLAVVAHTILVSIPRSVPAFSVNWNNAIMPHLQTANGGSDVDGSDKSGLVRKSPKTLDTKHHQQQRQRSLLLHFLSGLLFFGGVALNCKISAMALVPFLFTWSLLQRVAYHFAQIGANLWAVVVWEIPLLPVSMLGSLWKNPPVLSLRVNVVLEDVLAHWGAFALGASLSHGPWVIAYWFYTGRILPNAWPSSTMLMRSPFLQAAVRKPWHSYVTILARVSPIHTVGLYLGAAAMEHTARRLYARLLAGGWILYAASHFNIWIDRSSRKIGAVRAYSPFYKQSWRRLAVFVNLVHTQVQRRTEVKLLEEQEISDEGSGGLAMSAAVTTAAGGLSPSPHNPPSFSSPSSSSSSSSMHQGMTIKPGETNTWMMQQMQQQALVDLLQSVEMRVAIFALWPLGFLAGHTSSHRSYTSSSAILTPSSPSHPCPHLICLPLYLCYPSFLPPPCLLFLFRPHDARLLWRHLSDPIHPACPPRHLRPRGCLRGPPRW